MYDSIYMNFHSRQNQFLSPSERGRLYKKNTKEIWGVMDMFYILWEYGN